MEWNFILRLCVAGLCGTVIGLDREYRVKDAGFRTHFLVALGSALMMIVSQYGFAGVLGEPGVGLTRAGLRHRSSAASDSSAPVRSSFTANWCGD